jgi:tetratricopeptide (TPR) repeat protein
MKNSNWLNLTEYLLLISSGVGSIASIASQQLAFTAAPVSFLLMLNLVNRRRHDQDVLESANLNIAQLDQRLSNDLKAIDQQVRSLPSVNDLANLRQTIQQRQNNAIARLQYSMSQRLAPIEGHDLTQMQQDLSHLQRQHSQVTESLQTVTQQVNQAAKTSRVEGTENAIAQLQTELSQLHSKLNEITTQQKQAVPRALQDEIHQLHRRLNSLPQPFDATALKQDVDGLVKVVGDMVSRRELARLMAEVEKIRQQHRTLEQTVAPMKSVNAIMRKQMDTLSSWVTVKDGNQAMTIKDLKGLENLKNTVSQLEKRLTNLPQILDSSALQSQIKYLTSRLECTEEHLSELSAQLGAVRSSGSAKPDNELVFTQSTSSDRTLLEDALNKAQTRVIVVFPYLDRALFDDELVGKFQAFLERGGLLDIGLGHLGNFQSDQSARYIYDRSPNSDEKTCLRTVLHQLTQFKRTYPTQLRFKVLGTDENFLVCDNTYSILGVHPVPTTSGAFPEVAVGLRTTNSEVIKGLIDRYNDPLLHKNDAIAHFNRAVTRYELGDKAGAIADYSEVLRIQSNHDVAYNNQALIRYELGDQQGAIAALNQAILSNPQSHMAYCNRGIIRFRQGDKTGAIEDFNGAIQINSKFANAYLQRGLARLQLGNKIGAIGDFTAMLRINSQDPVAYFQRGLARSEMRDRTGAIRDLKEAAWLFSSQGDKVRHQQAIDAINKLRRDFVQPETPELRLVREA